MAGNMKSIPTLDKKGYREFGLVTGAIVVGLFGLLLPWIFDWNFPRWPWIIFGVLGAMALIAPMSLKPVYKYWMMFGLFMPRKIEAAVMPGQSTKPNPEVERRHFYNWAVEYRPVFVEKSMFSSLAIDEDTGQKLAEHLDRFY